MKRKDPLKLAGSDLVRKLELKKGGDSVPIIGQKPDASSMIIKTRPDARAVEEILLGKARHVQLDDQQVRDRLVGIEHDAHQLAGAHTDAKSFDDLVAAAARKGKQHQELVLRLAGCSLVSAKIIYELPDYPDILQFYIWQELDMSPKYPRLRKFVAWWMAELDGPVREVMVCDAAVFSPRELRTIAEEFVH